MSLKENLDYCAILWLKRVFHIIWVVSVVRPPRLTNLKFLCIFLNKVVFFVVVVVGLFVLCHKSALIIKKTESCLIGRDEKHTTNAKANEKYQSPWSI